jgi:hypothetical protein
LRGDDFGLALLPASVCVSRNIVDLFGFDGRSARSELTDEVSVADVAAGHFLVGTVSGAEEILLDRVEEEIADLGWRGRHAAILAST